MQITFLGTSCMVPTKERNVPAVFLKYKTDGILFDCGEGTQRQMNITGIKRSEVTKILVSHWHGDHVSGIIGLIQTLGNIENPPKLEIYGPKETEKRMDSLMKVCYFEQRIKLKIIEVDPDCIETIFENEDYIIQTANMKHGLPCIGFSFIEKDKRKIKMDYLKKMNVKEGKHLQDLQKGKSITYKGKKIDVEEATSVVEGKKITYIPDTEMCDNAIELARDADLLICESTYATKQEDKAEKYRHLTAAQAASIANYADAKKLVLTHFSQRYKNTQEIEEDARTYFDNIICAKDFMKIRL